MANRFTDQQKLAEVRRELSYRQTVYPGIARKNPRRADDLHKRKAIMEAIEQDYVERIETSTPQLKLEG